METLGWVLKRVIVSPAVYARFPEIAELARSLYHSWATCWDMVFTKFSGRTLTDSQSDTIGFWCRRHNNQPVRCIRSAAANHTTIHSHFTGNFAGLPQSVAEPHNVEETFAWAGKGQWQWLYTVTQPQTHIVDYYTTLSASMRWHYELQPAVRLSVSSTPARSLKTKGSKNSEINGKVTLVTCIWQLFEIDRSKVEGTELHDNDARNVA